MELPPTPVRITRKRALRIIDICISGSEAEGLHRGGTPRRINGRWDGDWWEIKEAAWSGRLDLNDREIRKLIEERRPLVRSLLRAHWSAVEAVARLLLQRGEAGPRTLRRVIRDALSPAAAQQAA